MSLILKAPAEFMPIFHYLDNILNRGQYFIVFRTGAGRKYGCVCRTESNFSMILKTLQNYQTSIKMQGGGEEEHDAKLMQHKPAILIQSHNTINVNFCLLNDYANAHREI